MVVSVEEAGRILGCKERQIFYLLARGVLERAPRYGKEIRIYKASVERALMPRGAKAKKRNASGSVPLLSVRDFPL